MDTFKRFVNSSLGQKYIMAGTGCLLLAFVVVHLIGNLLIFAGPKHLNAYGHLLQSTPEVLWFSRIILLTAVVLHCWSALRLWAENRRARGAAYLGDPPAPAASYASRTMLMSGLIVASFIIYHLLHFTAMVPAVNLAKVDFTGAQFTDPAGHHDVFRMVVLGFSQPLVVLFYLLGVGLLCLHLSHGVRAIFQSLGIPLWRGVPERLARVLALVLFAGYSSIPVAILLFGYGRQLAR